MPGQTRLSTVWKVSGWMYTGDKVFWDLHLKPWSMKIKKKTIWKRVYDLKIPHLQKNWDQVKKKNLEEVTCTAK